MVGTTSFNGPLVTAQQIALEVARGRVPGAKPFSGFGRMATGAITNAVIYPVPGGFKYPDATGVTLSLVSSSAQDAPGGTGVGRVEVHYLKTDFSEASAIIELSGLTPVTTDINGAPITDVRFIQCMHMEQKGIALPAGAITSQSGAAGTIRAYSGADDYSVITAGEVRCTSSARMVPKGKRAVVPFLVGSSISSTSDSECEISVAATEFDTHQYTEAGIFIPFGALGIQNGGVPGPIEVPGVFSEGTVVALLGSASKAATLIAGFFGWTEDAP